MQKQQYNQTLKIQTNVQKHSTNYREADKTNTKNKLTKTSDTIATFVGFNACATAGRRMGREGACGV